MRIKQARASMQTVECVALALALFLLCCLRANGSNSMRSKESWKSHFKAFSHILNTRK